jgi:hypothetical protein
MYGVDLLGNRIKGAIRTVFYFPIETKNKKNTQLIQDKIRQYFSIHNILILLMLLYSYIYIYQ